MNKSIEQMRSEKATVSQQREILDAFKSMLPLMARGDISDVAEVLAEMTKRELEESRC